ncbi:hypothetical protein Plec18170_001755 [Paecilomyces lecythidis]
MAGNRTLKNSSLLINKNLIDGEWVESKSGRTFPVYVRLDFEDPATEELLGTLPESTAQDTEQAIDAAAASMPEWRNLTGRERSHVLRRWFYLIKENADDLAALISWENGKAAADAAAEVAFAASFLEWFSEEAARVYGEVIPHSARGFRVMVLREPVGVCGLITPPVRWNFPGAMITRKLGPALAAGCSVVVKPAGETPFTANALIWLAEQAGVPKGVINVVHAAENTPEIGEVLCSSTIVRKISFTGSTRVGRLLMKQSGDTIKELSLELGGNAPVIVFDDADLDVAIQAIIIAKFKVTGQTCVCANRIYVQSGIYSEFIRRLTTAVRTFKVGNARDSTVTHGPLINSAAASRVAELVDEAIERGAKAVTGGTKIPSLGSLSPAFPQDTNADQPNKEPHSMSLPY